LSSFVALRFLSPNRYHLLDNNCNHFTNDVSNFLTGRDIPADIRNQPSELINTFGFLLFFAFFFSSFFPIFRCSQTFPFPFSLFSPIGQMMRPMIEQMFGPSSIPAGAPLFSQQQQPFYAQQSHQALPHAQQPPPAASTTLSFMKVQTPGVYSTGQIVTIVAKLKGFLAEEKLSLESDPASIDVLDRALKSAFNTKTLKLTDSTYKFIGLLLL